MFACYFLLGLDGWLMRLGYSRLFRVVCLSKIIPWRFQLDTFIAITHRKKSWNWKVSIAVEWNKQYILYYGVILGPTLWCGGKRCHLTAEGSRVRLLSPEWGSFRVLWLSLFLRSKEKIHVRQKWELAMCECELPFVFVRLHEGGWDGLQPTPANHGCIREQV